MQQELHLRDVFRILRKHRVAILIVFLVAVAGAALVTFLKTPEYEATTRLVIDRTEPDDLTDRTRAMPRDPEFFETQYQLIKSAAVAWRVAEQLSEEEGALVDRLFGAAATPSAVSVLWQKFVGPEEKTPAGAAPPEAAEVAKKARLVQAVREGIRVRPVEGSRMVQVTYMSPDPRFAALVANLAVEGYKDEISKMKLDTSKRSVDWMNRKAEGEAQKLKEAEEALQNYTGSNDILTLENRIAVIPEKLSRLSTELVAAEAKRKQMEALVEKVSRSTTDPDAAESVAAVLSDQALQSLRSQIIAADKTILELSGKYGPKHPVMQKAQGELEILRQKKNQEIARITRSIRNEYELALANERDLRAQMEQTKNEAMRTNEKFVRYQSMKAELDANRKLFDTLLLRMKEEGITAESESVKLWVVEEAGIPEFPATPKKALNLSLGIVLGLLGGVGVAFFREYLDNTIRNPDDAEVAFQTPVLGTVSLLRGEAPVERIVLEEPLSALSESYKSLRTALLAAGEKSRRFLITSSLPGEGKTSTAVNLALAMAQAEKRILLIDGDMRKPRIHDIFRRGNSNGLSRLLAGTVDSETVWRAIQAGPLANLSLLTSGPVPPNPSELLMSTRMKELLRLLEEKYDVIICDSPPVLAVEDSRILSRLFHGTIVVAKAHRTTFEVAGRSLKLLRGVKAPVFGFVVNGLDQRRSEPYYHSKQYTAYKAETLKIKG